MLAKSPPIDARSGDGGDDGARKLPAVHVKDGEVFANSKDVADYFGKRHDHVLRDIDQTMDDMRAAGHSPDLGNVCFQGLTVPHPTVPKRWLRQFDMTKDGFALLVMSYTGAKAMAFKLDWLAAFNIMAAAVREAAEDARPQPQTVYLASPPPLPSHTLVDGDYSRIAHATAQVFGQALLKFTSMMHEPVKEPVVEKPQGFGAAMAKRRRAAA